LDLLSNILPVVKAGSYVTHQTDTDRKWTSASEVAEWLAVPRRPRVDFPRILDPAHLVHSPPRLNLRGILALFELSGCELATSIPVRIPHSSSLLSRNLPHFFPDGNRGPPSWTLTTTGRALSSPDSAARGPAKGVCETSPQSRLV